MLGEMIRMQEPFYRGIENNGAGDPGCCQSSVGFQPNTCMASGRTIQSTTYDIPKPCGTRFCYVD